jgi:hypothetical protein
MTIPSFSQVMSMGTNFGVGAVIGIVLGIVSWKISSYIKKHYSNNYYVKSTSRNATDTIESVKVIDYSTKTKHQLIEILREEKKPRKLNTESPNFTSTIEAFVPKSQNLIAMSMELYDTLKRKVSFKPVQRLTPEAVITKSIKQKACFNIRPTDVCIKKFDEPVFKSYAPIKPFHFPVEACTTPMKDGPITEQELAQAFKDIEIDKIDVLGISERIVQKFNDLTKCYVMAMFNDMYTNPSSPNVAITSFGKLYFSYKLAKQGSKDDLDSFRQIISIPKIASLFHRILTNRLTEYLANNSYIDTTVQKGVMPGSKFGIPEHIYKVKSVFRNAHKKNRPAFVLFIDITNAFGSLRLEQLYSILRKYKVPNNFINYIKSFHDSFEYYFDADKTNKTLKKWGDGIIQGSPLSPILFVTVMNYVLSYLNNKYKATHGYALNNFTINLFSAYVDDICITCDTYEHLSEVYTELKNIYAELGFAINNKKSALLSINDINNHKSLDGIEKTDIYKYLGEYVTDNASPDVPCEKFIRELYGKLKNLDSKKNKDGTDVELVYKAKIFTKCIWPWIQRKGIAMYDIGECNKKRIIQDITKFTDTWNVSTEITIDSVFRNIKTILGDTTDEVICDIIDQDDSDYIKGTNELTTKFLFRKSTHLTNFTYNNVNDTEIIDHVLNSNLDASDDNDEINDDEEVKDTNTDAAPVCSN